MSCCSARWGPAACLLGKTWGYDDTSIWVSDGCSGEFGLGQAAAVPVSPAGTASREEERIQTWGSVEPGKGFLLGRTNLGELSLSAYAVTRWIDQLPSHQTFTDHLGRVQEVDTRDDIYSHRIMLFFKGWIGRPKLVYTLILWTVNTTGHDKGFYVQAAFYPIAKKLELYGTTSQIFGDKSAGFSNSNEYPGGMNR